MNSSVRLIAGVMITPIHHKALLDEFGEIFISKLFDEESAFVVGKEQYIIGLPVGDEILVHNTPMICAGTCFDYNMKVNKFIGSLDDRLLRTITQVEGDARNGIWILHD